jgi:hypothetical protein
MPEPGGAGWALASLVSLAALNMALVLVLWAICRLTDVRKSLRFAHDPIA